MHDVDIFKEERQELLEKFEKERKELLKKGKNEGKIEGKIEALRESVLTLLLAKFKDSYTLQMRNAVSKAKEDILNYITAHIFDITLEDINKIFFISYVLVK